MHCTFKHTSPVSSLIPSDLSRIISARFNRGADTTSLNDFSEFPATDPSASTEPIQTRDSENARQRDKNWIRADPHAFNNKIWPTDPLSSAPSQPMSCVADANKATAVGMLTGCQYAVCLLFLSPETNATSCYYMPPMKYSEFRVIKVRNPCSRGLQIMQFTINAEDRNTVPPVSVLVPPPPWHELTPFLDTQTSEHCSGPVKQSYTNVKYQVVTDLAWSPDFLSLDSVHTRGGKS
jgi:hypothetical protein